MADESFYGITLSATKKTETWDPEGKDMSHTRTNKLVIRQALLGPECNEDELNVIQVETMSMHDAVKMPMTVLKAKESRQVRLDIEFPDAPVTFTLIQGSGPVHLIGQHMFGSMIEGFDDIEEIEEEMDEEDEDDSQFKDEEEDDGDAKGKKAKVSNNSKGKGVTPKKNAKK